MSNRAVKITRALALGLLFLAIPLQVAIAAIIETGNDVQFTPLHKIEDDVYAFSGKNISMDGFIDGDFTVFSNGLFINGEITGNGNFFSQQVNHNGKIARTLHAFAETVNINGIVGRSGLAFCRDFVLSSNGLIERDLVVMSARTDISGTVNGNASVHSGEVRIDGVIEGNLEVEAHKLTISPPAVIKGDLIYKSEEARIDTAGGVVIAGTIKQEFASGDEEGESEGFRTLVVTISELMAAFLFGLLILIPFKRHVKEAVVQLSDRFVVSLAAGFITVLIFLFAVAVAFVSLIAFLIGYALISGNAPAAGALVLVLSTIILPISSFSAVSGGILFYLGKIILAFLVGHTLSNLIRKKDLAPSKAKLILGLVALAIVFEIPYLGVVIYLLGSLTGAGAIVLAVRKLNFEMSRTTPEEPSTTTS